MQCEETGEFEKSERADLQSPQGSGETLPAESPSCCEETVWTIPSACHWYHLIVTDWDTSEPRTLAKALLLSQHVQRSFWGWNRAKHAILEATILATRYHLIPRAEVEEDLQRLEQAVFKTAGERELHAWYLLKDFFQANS